jgi:predicted dehydrogenase
MRQPSDKVRWGILGTGKIAALFATGLATLPEAELVAVGSRAEQTAREFGARFNVSHGHCHGSYEDLANDPLVDVIYVATPHMLHKDCTLLCLAAGKPVLCEKPLAINATEAQEMIAAARRQNLFLMEAMWTRFTPVMQKVRALLAEKAIGEVRMLSADFGFRAELNPSHRLFSPAYGGGALLDVGTYLVSFSSMVLGRPSRIVSMAHLGETGVDEQAAMIFGHEGGQLAVLSAAIRTDTPTVATIMGTGGQIDIDSAWYKPTTMTLKTEGKEPQQFHHALAGNGFNYEAAEVIRCLQKGELESPVMPLEESLSIMRTLDEIRAQWGLHYPVESGVSSSQTAGG